jgi:hypothetical protein
VCSVGQVPSSRRSGCAVTCAFAILWTSFHSLAACDPDASLPKNARSRSAAHDEQDHTLRMAASLVDSAAYRGLSRIAGVANWMKQIRTGGRSV